MIKFLRSLLIFIALYRMGYNLSGNWKTWRNNNATDGFYRLNYENGGVKEYAIIDIDFMRSKKHNYSHIHGGSKNTSIFRVDNNKITVTSEWQ